jgi:RHS repeat-associated protein
MVYGFGRLLSEERPVGPRYVQGDQVGSPNLLTDALGVVTSVSKNLPFGERFVNLGEVGEKSLRRFTSHLDQPGSVIYMQARDYLPVFGRFAQVDPEYDQKVYSKDSWNLYGYVANNPVTHVDPTGKQDQNFDAAKYENSEAGRQRAASDQKDLEKGAIGHDGSITIASPVSASGVVQITNQDKPPTENPPQQGQTFEIPSLVGNTKVALKKPENRTQNTWTPFFIKNVSLGIGIEWEFGFGSSDTHGLVQGTVTSHDNSASGQITTSMPEPAKVYGAAFSTGRNLTIGNANNGSELKGGAKVNSVTVSGIQVTLARSGSTWQLGVGGGVGISYSSYRTYSISTK